MFPPLLNKKMVWIALFNPIKIDINILYKLFGGCFVDMKMINFYCQN